MLTEASIDCERIKTLVFGIGLNVNIPTKNFPESLNKESISLHSIIGEELRLHELTAKLIKVILGSYKQTLSQNLQQEVLNGWDELDELNGKKIRITSGKEEIIGMASGIDFDGNLLVKVKNGRIKKIHSGEIKVF